MKENLQKGFTLVELLVVIAIVGILAAALITNMTSGIEAGRSLKCKANLKGLAQAVSSLAVGQSGEDGGIAPAGSFEYSIIDKDTLEFWYFSSSAWVTWTPNGGDWPYRSNKSEQDNMAPSIFYDTSNGNNSKAVYSITNGVLWSYVGKDASVYLCETHKKVMAPVLKARIYRSFVMNRYFGYDDRNNPSTYRRGINLGNINQSGTAAIRILFAELPGQLGQAGNFSAAPWSDSVLSPENSEYLGFNHKVGNKWVANVAFADGHVDGVVEPTGANPTDLKDLTQQMCDGVEIESTLRAKMQ
jgi:prepilin-type N-terminal cleavage/methylation domain-containing protein/prepilin-type processing-associated H-X9-DG protein